MKPLIVNQYQKALQTLRGQRRDADSAEALIERLTAPSGASMGHRQD
jgi:hypothetical protein